MPPSWQEQNREHRRRRSVPAEHGLNESFADVWLAR